MTAPHAHGATPLSPCGRGVGARKRGLRLWRGNPSSGASRHLLPQGEKGCGGRYSCDNASPFASCRRDGARAFVARGRDGRGKRSLADPEGSPTAIDEMASTGSNRTVLCGLRLLRASDHRRMRWFAPCGEFAGCEARCMVSAGGLFRRALLEPSNSAQARKCAEHHPGPVRTAMVSGARTPLSPCGRGVGARNRAPAFGVETPHPALRATFSRKGRRGAVGEKGRQ